MLRLGFLGDVLGVDGGASSSWRWSWAAATGLRVVKPLARNTSYWKLSRHCRISRFPLCGDSGASHALRSRSSTLRDRLLSRLDVISTTSGGSSWLASGLDCIGVRGDASAMERAAASLSETKTLGKDLRLFNRLPGAVYGLPRASGLRLALWGN